MNPVITRHQKRALLIAALCLSSSGHARADQKIICPPEITSSQVSVAAAKGWVGWPAPDRKVKLLGAGVLLGPIRLNGELKGEEEHRKDGSWVNKFVLTGGEAPGIEKWMACNYGAEYFQAIQLPATTRECAVSYRRDKSPPKSKPAFVVADISCK